MQKYVKLKNGIVDAVSFYPDRNEEGFIELEWVEVPDHVFAGFELRDGEWVAPVVSEPVSEEISRRQFCQGLAVAGLITKQEAITFIQGSALPEAMQGIVDGMVDEEAAFEATMLLLGAGSFFRSHPLVLIFAMAQSMTEAQVDDFWRLCASL